MAPTYPRRLPVTIALLLVLAVSTVQSDAVCFAQFPRSDYPFWCALAMPSDIGINSMNMQWAAVDTMQIAETSIFKGSF
jgi:hypothetical protein